VKDPHVAGRLTAEGIDPLGSSPEEFAATLASDLQIWAEAVKLAGLQDK
jgi:tripartite-type tricarboxylate transporter receptor subunit TctC